LSLDLLFRGKTHHFKGDNAANNPRLFTTTFNEYLVTGSVNGALLGLKAFIFVGRAVVLASLVNHLFFEWNHFGRFLRNGISLPYPPLLSPFIDGRVQWFNSGIKVLQSLGCGRPIDAVVKWLGIPKA